MTIKPLSLLLFAMLLLANAASYAAGYTEIAENGERKITIATQTEACFLLWELGVGQLRREPADACQIRLSPASTFKIPHALAALDAGVISATEQLPYDGTAVRFASWQRDHSLQSAMHHSVVWFFQHLAQQLGPERETAYLNKLNYGNRDASSGLTTFWLGESLQITPEEQQAFLLNFYQGKLPIQPAAVTAVKAMLVQPTGKVINAVGEHSFNAPWPDDVVVSAKTGSVNDAKGRGIRWLVGHVQRNGRAFVFVSSVVGTAELKGNAAVELAAQALREEKIL